MTMDRGGAQAPARPAFGLWKLGFRPFYLLASLFAAVSVLLWVAQYAGWLPFQYVQSSAWHGSEMLFGYATAVVAGFLFTAARNWTGQPTPTGPLLAALAALWLAGRILVVTPWSIAAAAVNAAFPLAVAAGIAVPMLRAGNRRNYFFVALLASLGVLALAVNLAWFGVIEWPARAGLQLGLDVILLIMAVMGGRVIPMFTNNGVPGTRARREPWIERLALGGIVLLVVADLVEASAAALAILCAALAIVHGARLWLWQPWRTRRTPLVWILHAAYGWIVLHLALRALSLVGLVSPFLATHALTIGGIGGLTIGMMTRTARGHTGRPLLADRADVTCYVLIMLAALSRVVAPMLWPEAYVATVAVAGACWAAAFLLYFASYLPWLLRARLDGKPG
jgi:uncharacterized protein involved in response to NO